MSKLKMSGRLLKKRVKKSGFSTAKRCRFTCGELAESSIDYKNVDLLRNFLTERGKILPSRISGNAAYYQRKLSREIRKSRTMALLPYSQNY